MSEHTKEPWQIVDERTIVSDNSEDVSDPIFIAEMLDTTEGLEGDCPAAIANGRRIVACVNACASFTTDQLESEDWVLMIAMNPDKGTWIPMAGKEALTKTDE